MLRQRLVRQSALENSSGSNSLEGCIFRPISPDGFASTTLSHRRHSVAGGVVGSDFSKSLGSVFSSTLRRMSNACSFVSSTYSSQPSLSLVVKKEEEVMLPAVLDTFKGGIVDGESSKPLDAYNSNRRFSTDYAPPSYKDATSTWKIPPLLKYQKFSRASDLNDLKEKSLRKDSSESESDKSDLHEVIADKS